MSEKNTPNIILYLSYWEHIKMLDLKQRGHLLTALFCLQLGEEIPEMDPVTTMAFSFIKADISRNNDRYNEIIEKRREAGRKGGIASGRARKSEANEANEAKPSIEKEKEKENEKEKEIEIEKETVCVNTQTRAREDTDTHTTPTPDMVKALFLANGRSADDAQAFIEYNDSKGWPFSLETAFKKWRDRDRSGAGPGRGGGTNKFINFDQRGDRDPDYYERIVQEKLAAQEAARVKEG